MAVVVAVVVVGSTMPVAREHCWSRGGGRHAGGRVRVVIVGSGGAWSVVIPVARNEGWDGAADGAEWQSQDAGGLKHVRRFVSGRVDASVARAGAIEVGARHGSDAAPTSR